MVLEPPGCSPSGPRESLGDASAEMQEFSFPRYEFTRENDYRGPWSSVTNGASTSRQLLLPKVQNAVSLWLLQVLASGHSDHCKAALACSFHRDDSLC